MMAAGPIHGQSGSDNPGLPPEIPNTLRADRVQSEILGLSVAVPKGARGEHISSGDDSRLRVFDSATPPNWVVTIRLLRMPPSVGETEGSPATLAQLFLEDARRMTPDLRVLEEQPANIQQMPAFVVRVEIPHEASGRIARYDWMFIQTGPNRFILVEALTPSNPDESMNAPIDEILESLELTDEFTMANTWRDRLKAGAEIIGRIDERVLRKLLETNPGDAWYRQHAYDGDGNEIEIGYVGISMLEATPDQVGRLNPQPSTGEDSGLLVRVRSHRFPRNTGEPRWDTDMQCWLAWDREEESFSTVATGRVPNTEDAISLSVIGVRPRPTAGRPVRMLEVLSSRADTFTRDQVSLEIPDSRVYLAEAERLVLASILPLVGAPAGEFSVWGWQPERREITRRLDSWELAKDGGWILRTRGYPDAPESTARIEPDGRVTSRVVATPNGTERWTLMEPDALRSFYLRKGINPDS